MALIEQEDDDWALDELGLKERIEEICREFQKVDDTAEGQFASDMVKGHITDKTQEGHLRCVTQSLFLFSQN